MYFLHSLHRPKWAASQVWLTLSTRGLSTAQWSVTTAVNMQAIPTRSTKMEIFIFVRLCMFPGDEISVQSIFFPWYKSIKFGVLQCGYTGLCPRGFFPQWLQQASHKVSSPFLSLHKTSVFSLCLWFEGKGARLLCPRFKSPFPYSLWVAAQQWGCKFRLTAVEVNQESWWPNQLSAMVGNGCGATACVGRCWVGESDAINVTGESSCQAICLSGYSASGWRCVTYCYKVDSYEPFLSSKSTHKV